MGRRLTFAEKQYVEGLIKQPKALGSEDWPSWAAWCFFALGGFLIAFVCFLTATDLNVFNIKYVLSPGIFAGMILLFGGYWMQYMSKKEQDNRMLVGILKKLMDNSIGTT